MLTVHFPDDGTTKDAAEKRDADKQQSIQCTSLKWSMTWLTCLPYIVPSINWSFILLPMWSLEHDFHSLQDDFRKFQTCRILKLLLYLKISCRFCLLSLWLRESWGGKTVLMYRKNERWHKRLVHASAHVLPVIRSLRTFASFCCSHNMKPLIEDAKHPTTVTHVIFDMDGLLLGESGVCVWCLLIYFQSTNRHRESLWDRYEKCVRKIWQILHVGNKATDHGDNWSCDSSDDSRNASTAHYGCSVCWTGEQSLCVMWQYLRFRFLVGRRRISKTVP